jgi:hypothetical protein
VNDEMHVVVVVVVVRPRFDHESSRERENFVKDEFDCDNPTCFGVNFFSGYT